MSLPEKNAKPESPTSLATVVPLETTPVDAENSIDVNVNAFASVDRLNFLQKSVSGLCDISTENAKQDSRIFLIDGAVDGYQDVLLTLAVERPDVCVVLLSDQMPVHLVQALTKFRAFDVLSLHAEGQTILGSIEKIDTPQETRGDDSTSSCWAFRGAVGGAGVTTLAVECAFQLADRLGPGKVCIVDLNVSDGMVCSFLEGIPKLDLEALSDSPERLDAKLLAAWCWRHDSGVDVIAAPRSTDADLLATEEAIYKLLDVACNAFDYVILDMPRHRLPWTGPVLSVVDEVMVVSEMTVPSLHAAADVCRTVNDGRDGRRPARLILNRMMPKKRFRVQFDVQQAERAIECDIQATITSDWESARMGVNLGQPILHVKPKSPLVKDISALVEKLLEARAVSDAAAI